MGRQYIHRLVVLASPLALGRALLGCLADDGAIVEGLGRATGLLLVTRRQAFIVIEADMQDLQALGGLHERLLGTDGATLLLENVAPFRWFSTFVGAETRAPEVERRLGALRGSQTNEPAALCTLASELAAASRPRSLLALLSHLRGIAQRELEGATAAAA